MKRSTLTFLIVSRDSLARDLLSVILKRAGNTVFVASSPEEGLSIIRRVRITIAFLDGRAESMVEPESLRSFRSCGSRIGLVLLADEKNDSALGEAVEIGAQAVLSKPFDGDNVLRLVDRLIGAQPVG